MFFKAAKMQMPSKENALPGHKKPILERAIHHVNGHSLFPDYPQDTEIALFGLGCFWGAERRFWKTPGVYVTAVGYSAGYTKNPTYDEVCTGLTGHNEVVRVVFVPEEISYEALLKVFWESHNPTQFMRQGNDMGTQYRSGIYVYNDEQKQIAEASKVQYQQALSAAGQGEICTEIQTAGEFYYAEEYHQQYLAKNPEGYCGLGGLGVPYPSAA